MGADKKKRRWWLPAVAVLAAVAGLSRIGGNAPAKVEVQHPSLGSITRSASAFGRIRAVDQVKISPDVSGEITGLYFDEGDTVKKGDLLLEIRQDEYLLAIERNSASLGSAIMACEAQKRETRLKESEYERLKGLYEGDATCLAQLEQAEAAAETAAARLKECEFRIAAEKASLAAARKQLAKTMVYSPMDGIVTSLRVKAGERVVGTSTMAGTEIMTIANLERMELVVQLGENDICDVNTGDRAEIRPDASPSSVLEGRVQKIAVASSGGSEYGSASDFEVRISIENQDIIKLLPGMSASAKIITGSKNDILTVPLQAVGVNDGRESVWTVDEKGRVSRVDVSCGIQDFNRVEVTGGLDGSELIVTGPYQTINNGLSEGDKVKLSKQ